MLVVKDPRSFQRGAEFASAILIGVYTCLLIATLWRPIKTRRLTMIGWTIITVYCLTVCRVAIDYHMLGRTLFANGATTKDSTFYMLTGLRQGFSFIASLMSDTLFCWRLYVIWSRSPRIVLIPACLLALNAVGFATIVVVNFILARRPNNTQLLAINYPLFVTVQSVVVAYTSYITVFIAIRLWWVGRAADRAILFETPRGNRYAGAISALIQSGVMQSATRIITICIAVGVNYSLVPTVGRIAVPINGISATLLFLQLDMFQQQKRDSDTPTLSTGATVKFAGQEGSSDGPFAPVARRQRRASTSILYQRHESFNDTGEMHLSSPIHVASTQHSARLSPSDHSATTTILPNKLEGKEVV